jgi:hypothetical protein
MSKGRDQMTPAFLKPTLGEIYFSVLNVKLPTMKFLVGLQISTT